MGAWETLQELDRDGLIAAFNKDCDGRGITASVYLDELRHREIIGVLEHIQRTIENVEIAASSADVVRVNELMFHLLEKIEVGLRSSDR